MSHNASLLAKAKYLLIETAYQNIPPHHL